MHCHRNHPADSIHFFHVAIFLGYIHYQIQEFVPFVPGHSAAENYQVMFAAGIKRALWKLHYIVFNHYPAQRKKFDGVDFTKGCVSRLLMSNQ